MEGGFIWIAKDVPSGSLLAQFFFISLRGLLQVGRFIEPANFNVEFKKEKTYSIYTKRGFGRAASIRSLQRAVPYIETKDHSNNRHQLCIITITSATISKREYQISRPSNF